MQADPRILETWLIGWTLSRGTPPPMSYHEGFSVDVGWAEQRMRYVFPEITDAFRQLGERITTPFILLKAAVPVAELRAALPARWVVQPQGYLMACDKPMLPAPIELPEGYALDIRYEGVVTTVEIKSSQGELASVGHIVTVDDYTIYDRIDTHPEHRRRGLASIVMKTLEKEAYAKNPTKGILVATAEGKLLYESLG